MAIKYTLHHLQMKFFLLQIFSLQNRYKEKYFCQMKFLAVSSTLLNDADSHGHDNDI